MNNRIKVRPMHKSEWLKGGIFDEEPATWQQLQVYVAQVFRDLGYLEVQSPYSLVGVRTTKEVDVYAVDPSAVPPIRIACECKHWSVNVHQGVVMEFRTVIEDTGVNRGFIISKVGFQSPGAYDAVRNTAVVLISFDEFTRLFFDQWLTAMSLRLAKASKLIFPFFDPYGFETLPELPPNMVQTFSELRKKYHVVFSSGALLLDNAEAPVSLAIIARNPQIIKPLKELGITSYRQFFSVLLTRASQALIEFSSLFGVDPETLRSSQTSD